LAVIENIAEAARVKPLKAKELLGAPRGRHPDAAHARRVLGSITLKTQTPLPWRAAGSVTTRLVAGARYSFDPRLYFDFDCEVA
jgi:hypothetical protein